MDDAEEFRGVKAAFDTIGMDEESQMQVWQMLASVLHMSNLEYDKVDHEQGEIASIADREVWSICLFDTISDVPVEEVDAFSLKS